MSLNTWIRTAKSDQWKWRGRSPHGRIARRPRRPVQLQVEWLEGRTMLKPGGLPLPIPISFPPVVPISISIPPIVTITILPNPINIFPNPTSILPNPGAILPNPISIPPSPIPVLSNPPPVLNLPPVLSSPSPGSQPGNSNASSGTAVLSRNYQAYSGFSTQNQTSFYSAGSLGFAPIGGSSGGTLSSGKPSQEVVFLSGIGEEDQESILDMPVQLNMTSDDEAFSTSDIAAALLVGVRPKLLPQKGSQVAPVATLLTDDSGEEMSTATEEENPLKDSLINPLSQIQIGSFQSSLRMQMGENLSAKGFDNLDGTPSPKSLFNLSPLAVLAGALVALWGIQKYRNGKVKPAQPGLET